MSLGSTRTRARAQCSAQTADGLDRAVDERKLLAVDRLEAADDLGGDLLGRFREPDHVVHVARPLGELIPIIAS